MLLCNEEFNKQILFEFHCPKVGDHAGVTKNYCICSEFYWPEMQADIRQCVRGCSICLQAKVDHALPLGLLHLGPFHYMCGKTLLWTLLPDCLILMGILPSWRQWIGCLHLGASFL